MRNKIKKTAIALFVCLLSACRLKHAAPDPSIKRISVGGTNLAVKEDKSWLQQPQKDLIGFRIRIDYPSGKTFTMQQNSTIDFGIQDHFSLVDGGDTLSPAFFQRIAGGTVNQAEYLAAFEPKQTTGPNKPHYRLLFQDPIFGLGNRAIDF
jgi:hypothetical protein